MARIVDAFEAVVSEPPLYLREHVATARVTACWSDSVLFQTAVAILFQPVMLQQIYGQRAPGAPDLRAFIDDRVAMTRGATTRRPPALEARATLAILLWELDAQLVGNWGFLHGVAPAISDY